MEDQQLFAKKEDRPHLTAWILLIIFLVWFFTAIFYSSVKPLPEGVGFLSQPYSISNEDLTFFKDLTYRDGQGNEIIEQEIFDQILNIVFSAQDYIVIDMFLYNNFLGKEESAHRSVSQELTTALVNKKRQNPSMDIIVITDPINTVYGSDPSEQFELLTDNGVVLFETPLDRLRDSNFDYSGFYRSIFRWFNGIGEFAIAPHPFAEDKKPVSVQSYLRMFNFKANHRKLIIADDGQGSHTTLVTSFNPHDGSSKHTNVALQVDGPFAQFAYRSEEFVTDLIADSQLPPIDYPSTYETNDDARVRLATEMAVKDELLLAIDDTEVDDQIDIMAFYLSDRDVINALLKAARRGVEVRLILDQNKDAFGYSKNGIPNRPVAKELIQKSKRNIKVRYYDTDGEQMHAKMVIITKQDGTVLILGSANLTRRNLDNFNLETSIVVYGDAEVTAIQDANALFNRIWGSGDEQNEYSFTYFTIDETGFWDYVSYLLLEFKGLGTF